VTSTIFNASNLPTTTPTTLPFSPNRGPPLFPGCTGAVICIVRRSFPIPARAEMVPVVTMGSELNSPLNGKPTATTVSPARGPFPPLRSAAEGDLSDARYNARSDASSMATRRISPPRDDRTYVQPSTTCALVTMCTSVLTKNPEPDETTVGTGGRGCRDASLAGGTVVVASCNSRSASITSISSGCARRAIERSDRALSRSPMSL
jgi:hypothetical protein